MWEEILMSNQSDSLLDHSRRWFWLVAPILPVILLLVALLPVYVGAANAKPATAAETGASGIQMKRPGLLKGGAVCF